MFQKMLPPNNGGGGGGSIVATPILNGEHVYNASAGYKKLENITLIDSEYLSYNSTDGSLTVLKDAPLFVAELRSNGDSYSVEVNSVKVLTTNGANYGYIQLKAGDIIKLNRNNVGNTGNTKLNIDVLNVV